MKRLSVEVKIIYTAIIKSKIINEWEVNCR
nr:MAG TPA: hypothetical protein [Caudoviricetes sp.]